MDPLKEVLLTLDKRATFTDFIIAQNTAKAAEMASWTEEMKRDYWERMAREAPAKAAKEARQFKIFAITFVILVVLYVIVSVAASHG
jgi:hypothetical protein